MKIEKNKINKRILCKVRKARSMIRFIVACTLAGSSVQYPYNDVLYISIGWR